uniref:Uncharacterized protein n=1 Tax=Poecilia reticulata TaxID=8081 RepID=A0A3P9NC01_POERE
HVQQNASFPLKALLHRDLPPGNLSFSARSRGSPRTSRTTSLVCGPRGTVYSRQSRGSIRNLGKEEVTAAQQEMLFLQNKPSVRSRRCCRLQRLHPLPPTFSLSVFVQKSRERF